MNPLNLFRTNLTRPVVLRFFSVAALLVCLAFVGQIGRAQTAQQLSLADVLIALRSKKATLPERNKILSDAVKVRGITFSMTPEIETELGNTGADAELMDAIKQKSAKVAVAIVVKPTPAPMPLPTPAVVAVAAPTPTPKPVPTPDFSFYRKRADENNFKGEYDVALSDYNEAIKLNPKDAVSYLNRAQAFIGKKNFDAAITDYNQAIELDPKNAAAYISRADFFEKKGDAKQAISDYQKAVEIDANNEIANSNLKRLQQAAEQARTIQQPEPKKSETVAAVKEAPKAVESSNQPDSIELGQVNGLAVKMVTPLYPQMALKMNVQGAVTVQVALDETGKVVSAKATSGNTMLRAAAEEAARTTKFKPPVVGSRPVKGTGFIVYNFVNKQ